MIVLFRQVYVAGIPEACSELEFRPVRGFRPLPKCGCKGSAVTQQVLPETFGETETPVLPPPGTSSPGMALSPP